MYLKLAGDATAVAFIFTGRILPSSWLINCNVSLAYTIAPAYQVVSYLLVA